MTSVKLLACQAQSINLYQNLRTKIMKCCANKCTVIPRLTKIIRSGITFVSRNLP